MARFVRTFTKRLCIGLNVVIAVLFVIACINAWLQPIERLTVNTCTLDHPRALPLYQRLGFTAYNREERFVELP